jgi:hypothetical protein
VATSTARDILYVMLRSAFDDVIDEQTLPKVGHSSFRPDFAIPRLGVLVEVKFVRTVAAFKSIEREVMEDSVGYFVDAPAYRDLVVFIYDDSNSPEHHQQTKDALSWAPNVRGVVIVSRPGMLPREPA